MFNFTKKLALAAAAVFGLTAGVAQASTLKFYNDASTDDTLRFTLTCTGVCQGWVLPTSVFSGTEGDMFTSVDPADEPNPPVISGAADELAAINIRAGTAFASITKSAEDLGLNHVFTSDAAYFLIKSGQDPRWALVRNLTEGNKFTYAGESAVGAGLSHYSEAGDVCDYVDCDPVNKVPVPAGLPLLMGALGITGIVARRRRKA